MSKNKGENKRGKKSLGSMIITALATIIVIVASLLGFGGEDAENVVSNLVNNDTNSELISEVYEEESDDGEQAKESNDVIEDSEESVSVEEDSEESVSVEEDSISEESSENEIASEEEDIWEDITVAEVTFRSQKLLDQHYDKHGIEMGFASAEEYELAAYKVIIHPDTLHKIEAEDGDDVYYREETNEFVVVSQDGYIRTYFNPSAGIDYYNRQ